MSGMPAEALAFQERVLPGVSRTFALTIPQLPPALRTAIGNAYLLCRLADTIEDAAELQASAKQDRFALLVRALDDADAARQLSTALEGEITTATGAERELVAGAEQVFHVLWSLPAGQQAPVRRCLRIMAAGMSRFEPLKGPRGLATCTDFRDYCYCVAGVVGEMLTDLFALHEPAVAAARTRLRCRAVAFGQGLQMTNILKDIWEDHERGVCWLPQDVFVRHGHDLAADGPRHTAPAFHAGLQELIGVAHGQLQRALRYTLGIPPGQPGMRRFCAWAIGMALETLHNIHARPDFTAADQIRISRGRVRLIIGACNAAVRRDRLLRAAFWWEARGLPSPGPEHHALMAIDEETPWTPSP
ncbi:phytoene/squalene synthase family protein [Aquisalimonas lutea]|uniref:phytoene/squalene synthase family protein n=1 Tax=Aquisalimonas lutea TaxID=1327750 RepID=UPI0025B40D4F|nr:phytoene/squalene synthase family protein [Aquisalimonas lutea]MDN3516771.1 phytoene/squalene synthase family protein [Aquisalimonas lutea]